MIKRIFLFLMALVLLSGCTVTAKQEKSVFYYPRNVYQYNTSDGIISPESRETEWHFSGEQLLTMYLKGPLDETLTNPFPQDVTLVSIALSGETVIVTLSDSFASLSGAPLILACACIGRTAMELYGVPNAKIQCQSLLLDGKNFILINEDTVFFHDAPKQSQEEGE